jgi:hypothetical protein
VDWGVRVKRREFIAFHDITMTCPQARAHQPAMPVIGGEARISSSAKADFNILMRQLVDGTTSQPDEDGKIGSKFCASGWARLTSHRCYADLS